MSFYNVSSPNRFSVQNDDLYTQQHIDFLESGFNQPPAGTTINEFDNAGGATISANAIVNAGYINILDASGAITLPTAAQIVAALNNNQAIKELGTAKESVTVGTGFNFNVIFKAPGTPNLVASSGVTIQTAALNNGLAVYKVVVTNASTPAVVFVKLA